MLEVRIDARRVSYIDEGKGPAVVLLHCGGSTGRQWRGVMTALGNGYRFVAPDLWGHGSTEPWIDGARDHAAQARLVARLLDTLGIERAHVVGHSYGGATSMRLMLDAGSRVQSAVLFEPVLTPLLRDAGDEEGFAELKGQADRFDALVAAGDDRAAWKGFVDDNGEPGTWDRLDEASRVRMLGQSATIAAGFAASLDNPVKLSDVMRVRVPVTVVSSAGDPDIGRPYTAYQRIAELLGQHLPNVRFRRLSGVGHMAPVTHPVPSASVIAEHLRAEVAVTTRREKRSRPLRNEQRVTHRGT